MTTQEHAEQAEKQPSHDDAQNSPPADSGSPLSNGGLERVRDSNC